MYGTQQNTTDGGFRPLMGPAWFHKSESSSPENQSQLCAAFPLLAQSQGLGQPRRRRRR